MQVAPPTLKALGSDDRRIVIVGANGWIGRATLALLTAALGKEQALRRVVCFGSQPRMVEVEPGLAFPQQALSDLTALPPQPSLLLHLAFLTKDKVGAMDDTEYARVNRLLSQQVLDALGPIGVDRLFVASSGAAAFADDPAAAHDLRGVYQMSAEQRALLVRATRMLLAVVKPQPASSALGGAAEDEAE